jgi:signal transduction histidine kinase
MAERVKEVGGTLSLNSTLGEGFNINITIPVRKDDLNGQN